MFVVGGTDINIHKYLGVEGAPEGEGTVDQPSYDEVKTTNIQDLLFLENRDRKYETDVYTHRGIYNIQDIDFNLSQFGLFLSNDTIFLTVHIRSIVKTLGRKPISGDVIELPHLKDEYALNDFSVALKRYYVIEDVNRAAEGFSQTWWPHLYRLKLKQIYDGQEYAEILDLPISEDSDQTLRDVFSTYDTEMQISDAIVSQAEADSPKSGFNTKHFYTVAQNSDGTVSLKTVDQDIDTSAFSVTADQEFNTPGREAYIGYLMNYGDGIPPNGSPFGTGIQFPRTSYEGDYFLRTDFMPNRLFRYNGNRWTKVEDNLRMDLSNTDTKNTLKASFINNNNINNIGGDLIPERQALSKALRPKADN